MSTRRYFDILGIPPTKNETLIKKAYRRKALKYHPDRNPSVAAKDKFIEVTEAYDQLLSAIARGENLKETARSTTYTQSTTFRQTTTQQSTTKRKTASELREERIKEAQKRYENIKRREAEENERYYQTITSGKTWKRFKTIMFACTLISLLITLDMLYFPSKIQVSQIIKKNVETTYLGSDGTTTSAVKFENGQTAWISLNFIRMEQSNYLYLERTPLFKDIKFVKIWRNNEWRVYTPDFSLPSSFPLIPLALLFPLLTYFLKSRTYMFTMLFHGVMYVMPFFLLILMISNDRWAHLITFGLI